jgi:hypothetical protein
MAGKRIKDFQRGVDKVKENQKLSESFDQMVYRGPSDPIEVKADEEVYCAISGTRCDGRCREKNTENGMLICYEIMRKKNKRKR